MASYRFPQFIHHGAADGVTGSCHRYIASDIFHLLVDCGLFQGDEAGSGGEFDHRIEFDLSCVRALIVTHVHIDHIGRLPYLLGAGFKGPILCSMPSARLLPLVIEDALKLGFTRDRQLVAKFLETVQQQLIALPYRHWFPLLSEDLLQLQVRLQRAGHILGSAYVELELGVREHVQARWQFHRTVFSGDLGAPYAPLLPAPKAPYAADTLIIESTYGNRLHENRRERRLKLKAVIERALQNKGTVLIPAFSIGRTQELLYEFESILHEMGRRQAGAERGELPPWHDISIIVDSPLAAKFTAVYRQLQPFWDKEALQRLRSGRHPLSFEGLVTVDTHEDHERIVRYLAQTGRPAIVIAASGMAAGGRIVNYLQAMIGDPRHCVLFVGYQAPGTPGHTIQRHGIDPFVTPSADKAVMERTPRVWLDGAYYPIRAMVASIGGYSAHADQGNLLSFVRNMRRWPRQIRIVHGNDAARAALKRQFEQMARAAGKNMEVLLPGRER